MAGLARIVSDASFDYTYIFAGVDVDADAVTGLLLNDSLNFFHALLKPFFSFLGVSASAMVVRETDRQIIRPCRLQNSRIRTASRRGGGRKTNAAGWE